MLLADALFDLTDGLLRIEELVEWAGSVIGPKEAIFDFVALLRLV
jgi:hypothetical protein